MKSSAQLILTCLFALGSFLTIFSLQGQNYTVGVFNGQNTADSFPTPYADRFESTRAQYLYRAADLMTAGVPAGNLTALGFNVVSLNGGTMLENYTIKLALTSQTELTAWIPGATTVYGPIDFLPAIGLNEHTFNNGFLWDGTSNLVVEVCHSPPNMVGNYFSESASVKLTKGLPYPASLIYHALDDINVCNAPGYSPINAVPTSRPVLYVSVCQAPANAYFQSSTSTTASLHWTLPPSGIPEGYQWTYGLNGFVPGSMGTALGTVNTTDTSTIITGLNGNTQYSFYVRAKCGNLYSAWTGPVSFLTEASCNDAFTDSNAGLLSNYATSENYVRTFCPDEANKALTVSFTSFSTGVGDTLRIYNGNSTAAPLFGAFTGVYLPLTGPGPFTSTTSTGCLTVKFKSDTSASVLDLGWLASLTCATLPADSCYKVLQLKLNSVDFNTASISWTKMFGAPTYTYKLFEVPNVAPTTTMTTTDNAVALSGLSSGTSYIFVVQGNCTNGANSVWDTLKFFTPVRCTTLPGGNNSNSIFCGNPATVSATGTGLWNVTSCGGTTPGKERLFRFTPPNTRQYLFKLTTPTGSSNNYVNYFYKPVSAGCGPSDWTCIGSFNNAPDSSLTGVLVAGVEYFILADPATTATVNQSFKLEGCGPINDKPENAILLTLNTSCSQNIYSNSSATLDLNEPNPDTVAADGVVGRWTQPAKNTVWFRFIAPTSQTVTIGTNNSTVINSLGDSQIALYAVGDPANYATFTLVESDEDAGIGFNSNFTYTGLQAGTTYYIQVDSWGINAEGPFCIQVNDDAVRQTGDNCTAYVVESVSGSNWVNIYTSPATTDIGRLVLAVNPNNQNLGTVTAKIKTFPTIPISGNNIPYMPAYFQLSSSTAPIMPIDVRLFFYNSELDSLKSKAGLPVNTAANLVVSQYSGPNTDCDQLNNIGPSTLVPGVQAILMQNSFYLQFQTTALGEFGAHFGSVPLPLELQSFTGKMVDRSNLLEWATLTEKNVQWHVVERSADGLNWTEVGRVAGQVDSKALQNYSLLDKQPLPVAYYRLRSVDTDGTEAVSPTVHLVRPERAFGITEVLPNPATDRLTVRFNSPQEEQVTLRLFDFTGRLVLEQSADSEVGMNSVILPVSALPGGIYQLLLTDGSEVSRPVRIVKQ